MKLLIADTNSNIRWIMDSLRGLTKDEQRKRVVGDIHFIAFENGYSRYEGMKWDLAMVNFDALAVFGTDRDSQMIKSAIYHLADAVVGMDQDNVYRTGVGS